MAVPTGRGAKGGKKPNVSCEPWNVGSPLSPLPALQKFPLDTLT